MADPYREYADEYGREVERTLRSQPAPGADPLPAMRRALEEFEHWWSREVPASTEAEASADDGRLDALRRELERARGELEAVKTGLSAHGAGAKAAAGEAERAALRTQTERLHAENDELKRQLSDLHAQVSDAQAKAYRAQEGYEAAILRLEQQIRLLGDRGTELSRDKQFLEGQLARSADRVRDHEASLDEARAKAQVLEHENTELKTRVDGLQRELSQVGVDKASLEGSLRELRVQAGALQERILRGRETLEADLAERRRTLEQALAAAEEARSGVAEQLRRGFAEQRVEGDKQVRETARFLEAKLLEVERDASSHYEEVRGLLDALGRLLSDEDAR